jgi:hypothetical protein
MAARSDFHTQHKDVGFHRAGITLSFALINYRTSLTAVKNTTFTLALLLRTRPITWATKSAGIPWEVV